MSENLVLVPLAKAYGIAAQLRTRLYDRGVLGKVDAGPVVSIGNLTTGGTGKTPVVEWVARFLADEGYKPCILTRGYGRDNLRRRVIVSDDTSILADARQAGDEPLLLAENLKGQVPVICDRNRASAASWARENLAADIFVLDDGFQHMKIARDLDIVTVDSSDPWGDGRLLPAGRLREPISGLSRSDCVLLTRANHAADLVSLQSEVARASGNKPTWMCRSAISAIKELSTQRPIKVSSLIKEVANWGAFCAIGNPQVFFKELQGLGFNLTYTRAFRDHHYYSRHELERLARQTQACGAKALITTSKDAVKIRNLDLSLPCYVAEQKITFDNEESLKRLILDVVAGKSPTKLRQMCATP